MDGKLSPRCENKPFTSFSSSVQERRQGNTLESLRQPHNLAFSHTNLHITAPTTHSFFAAMQHLNVTARVIALSNSGMPRAEALETVALECGKTVSAQSAFFYRNRPDESRHKNNKLGSEQDQVLLWTMQAFSLNHAPMSNGQVVQLVNDLWGIQVSDEWVRRWVKQ